MRSHSMWRTYYLSAHHSHYIIAIRKLKKLLALQRFCSLAAYAAEAPAGPNVLALFVFSFHQVHTSCPKFAYKEIIGAKRFSYVFHWRQSKAVLPRSSQLRTALDILIHFIIFIYCVVSGSNEYKGRTDEESG